MQMLVRYYQSNGEPRNFDTVALSSLEDIKASPGKIICKIKADDKVNTLICTCQSCMGAFPAVDPHIQGFLWIRTKVSF